MLKKISILIIITLFAHVALFAQSTDDGPTQVARKEYLALRYALVTKMLEVELKDHPNNKSAQEMIADSYRRIRNYDKAVYWYAQLTRTQPVKAEVALRYAEVLANKQQYA